MNTECENVWLEVEREDPSAMVAVEAGMEAEVAEAVRGRGLRSDWGSPKKRVEVEWRI